MLNSTWIYWTAGICILALVITYFLTRDQGKKTLPTIQVPMYVSKDGQYLIVYYLQKDTTLNNRLIGASSKVGFETKNASALASTGKTIFEIAGKNQLTWAKIDVSSSQVISSGAVYDKQINKTDAKKVYLIQLNEVSKVLPSLNTYQSAPLTSTNTRNICKSHGMSTTTSLFRSPATPVPLFALNAVDIPKKGNLVCVKQEKPLAGQVYYYNQNYLDGHGFDTKPIVKEGQKTYWTDCFVFNTDKCKEGDTATGTTRNCGFGGGQRECKTTTEVSTPVVAAIPGASTKEECMSQCPKSLPTDPTFCMFDKTKKTCVQRLKTPSKPMSIIKDSNLTLIRGVLENATIPLCRNTASKNTAYALKDRTATSYTVGQACEGPAGKIHPLEPNLYRMTSTGPHKVPSSKCLFNDCAQYNCTPQGVCTKTKQENTSNTILPPTLVSITL